MTDHVDSSLSFNAWAHTSQHYLPYFFYMKDPFGHFEPKVECVLVQCCLFPRPYLTAH